MLTILFIIVLATTAALNLVLLNKEVTPDTKANIKNKVTTATTKAKTKATKIRAAIKD